MCVEVYVAAAERWCSNYGELCDTLGGEAVLAGDGYKLGREMCLCCVDLEATAEKFGKVTYRADEFGGVGLKDAKTSKRGMRAHVSGVEEGHHQVICTKDAEDGGK